MGKENNMVRDLIATLYQKGQQKGYRPYCNQQIGQQNGS